MHITDAEKKAFVQAVHEIWEGVAADYLSADGGYDDGIPAEEVVEVAVDANRMTGLPFATWQKIQADCPTYAAALKEAAQLLPFRVYGW